MNIADTQALQALALKKLEAALSEEERFHAAVYLDATLHPAGVIKTGSTSANMSQPSCTLFVDGKPGSNWMHLCRYLLMAADTGAFTSVVAEQPPAFGPLPATWSLLWRAPGVEDWQVLPLSSASAT